MVESSAVATLRIYPDIFCAIIDRYWLCIRQRLVLVSCWHLAVNCSSSCPAVTLQPQFRILFDVLEAAGHREREPIITHAHA